jgi:diguanylate cyclase (GGDEF)-like protein
VRILIAEDDSTSRTVLTAILKKYGHEVIVTINGSDALAKLQEPDPPLIAILDWMMPEMDGLEVVRQIRSQESPLPTYIIILTTKGGKADIIAGLDAGANDYLSKPFDPGELRARVEVGCRMVEMQAALIESRKALEHQATHDALMGMLNRRAILDHLRIEIARAERCKGVLAVGMCDIDHFKKINDTYGHQTGDDVLCGIAAILKEILRNYDSVGRMGGEEFLLVIPLMAESDCASLFERLRNRIAGSKIPTRSGDLEVTISIGVTCVVAANTVDAILELADEAMYKAKNGGRNQVVVHSGHFTS